MIGTIRLDGEKRAVRLIRRIAASPEQVWDAIIDPERMSRCCASSWSRTAMARC
jgi:uncharacterized protein YndB with AHSA1/START domain